MVKMAAKLHHASRFALGFASFVRPLGTSRLFSVEGSLQHFEGSQSLEEKGHVRQENRVIFIPNHKPTVISLQEALQALRAYSLSNIDETVEISLFCNLFMGKKKSKKRGPFRGTILYPHTFGREPKVLVFAAGRSQEAARSAGASVVGGTELVPQIASGELKDQFDLCLALNDVYDELKPFQKTLRKHMPTPKNGTVVDLSGLEQAVSTLKKTKAYKCDKQGNCNAGIGKLSFKDDQIEQNLQLLVAQVLGHREKQPNNTFIQSAVVSSTYGPGFDVSLLKYIKAQTHR